MKDKQSESDISEDENSESEKENTIAKQSTNKKGTVSYYISDPRKELQ